MKKRKGYDHVKELKKRIEINKKLEKLKERTKKMNSENGHVREFANMSEALKAGFNIQVSPEDFNKAQRNRFNQGLQPVVKLQDNKSILGKKRVKAKTNQSEMQKLLDDVEIGDVIKLGVGALEIMSIGKTGMLVKAIPPKGKQLKFDNGFKIEIIGGVFEMIDLGKFIKLGFLGLANNKKEKTENDKS